MFYLLLLGVVDLFLVGFVGNCVFANMLLRNLLEYTVLRQRIRIKFVYFRRAVQIIVIMQKFDQTLLRICIRTKAIFGCLP